MTTRLTNRTLSVLAVIAASGVGLAPLPALAQAGAAPAPETEVTNHNAALLYHRVWMTMDPDLQSAYVSGDGGPELAEGGGELLGSNQDTVGAILKATRQSDADWEVEYEQGPGALMPHLGTMRATARVLAADALRCTQEGDSAGAGERVAAVYRLAEHLDGDSILINTLVGMAICNLGNRLSVKLAEEDTLTPEAARTILDAMELIDPADPINLRATVLGERDIIANYILTHYTGPDAGARTIGMDGFGFDAAEPAPARLASMDGDELREDIRGYMRFHEDVLAVWDAPDATERIAALELGVDHGEYGAFAELLAASFSKARSNLDRFRTDYAETHARLDNIANP